MTLPGPAADDGEAAPDRRLHPWSWLFVLLQQLRQFVVPLVALVVFGSRRSDNGVADLWPLIGVVVLVVVSVLQYFTYRYRIGVDGISIRSGLLHRNLREIPFARIHNVVLHQSLLHRLFGVAEVRLEAAGGQKPEAQMRVLGMDQAIALERDVRHRGQAPADATAVDARASAGGDTLLALPVGEIIRLGLISNRGMIVFAAAFGLMWQVFPERLVAEWLQSSFRSAAGYAGQLHLGWIGVSLAGASVVAVFVALLRLLSVVLALTQYHGFRLSEDQRRLTVERGLFARLRTSVAPRRIQAWTLQEGLLHRWFGRRALRIDTAVGGSDHDPRALRELAPIATPAACDGLVTHLLPQLAWPPQWIALPGSSWWRLFLGSIGLNLVLTAILAWRFGWWGALALLWLPCAAWLARRHARRLAYAIDERLVAVRGGWWSRWWRFAEIDKLQALRLQRSPLDRRLGTASLWLDTAGASALVPPLRIRYLPLADAEALYARLSRALAGRRLRW
ncbi:PH domain-containing protein [Xanthomonas sp. XNM01]|uniref:PH domain-containing protein n=1 Tax=Xanthomonas sp. XNM01 TaxID=2769289 RepID=UPI001784AED1|nr:PH domain-containing protein [Xanthomonas sp. XNM01]